MNLTARQLQIIKLTYDHNRPLADGVDEQRRQLIQIIAGQIAFEFGPSWGTKRADAGRPLSKDAIAQKQPDGTLLAWDLFDGATRRPFANPSSMDISSQVFVAVAPVDHLGDTVVPSVPPVVVPPNVPPVPLPELPLYELTNRILQLQNQIEYLLSAVKSLNDRLATPIRTTTDYYHSHYVKF